MYSEEELQSAVQAGILTGDSVDALRAHVSARRNSPMVDEENFRLVSGFNDIFVALACTLVLGSIAVLVGYKFGVIFASFTVAAVSWFLAEPFTRKRRLAFPSILLSLSFSGGIALAAGSMIQPYASDLAHLGLMGIFGGVYAGLAAGGLAAWMHWKRFVVPIDVALGILGIVWCCQWALALFVPARSAWEILTSLMFGIAVFAVALHWDRQDPLRRTRKSDVAFWIHMIASPMLIRPMFHALGIPAFAGSTSVLQVAAALLVYVLLITVSLLVDRRALLVSGLIYVIIAFGMLLSQRGYSANAYWMMALLIGSALLILSAYWHRARVVVMKCSPVWLSSRVTPLRDNPQVR